jgi:hypothetical protein
MDYAHFNRPELDELDQLQGYRESDPQSGLRSYSGLEQMIQNPHNLQSLIGMLQQKIQQQSQQDQSLMGRGYYAGGMAPSAYADGGRVMGGNDYNNPYMNAMADSGRNGDNEIALIGPKSRMLFDHLALARGGCAVNPHTQKPEYFSLGGLFSGISNAFKPIMNAVAPIASQLAPIAGTAIGSAFGNPEAGAMIGNMAGNFLGANGAGQPPQQQVQPQGQPSYTQMGMQGLNNFVQNKTAGQNLGTAATNAARGVAGSMFNRFSPQIQQRAQGMMSNLPAPLQQPAQNMFNQGLGYVQNQFNNPYQS